MITSYLLVWVISPKLFILTYIHIAGPFLISALSTNEQLIKTSPNFCTMILFIKILFYTGCSSHFSAEITPWPSMLFTFFFGAVNILVKVLINFV